MAPSVQHYKPLQGIKAKVRKWHHPLEKDHPEDKQKDEGKMVYFFGGGSAEGNASMKELLGGKGANLAEMSAIGLNVPPGFTITTTCCEAFHSSGCTLPEGCWDSVLESLQKMEKLIHKKFADPNDPLLISVRSGAAKSMPGMMDTVLNLGLNDEIVLGLAKMSNERVAYDAYRRLLEMYGDVVMGINRNCFENEITKIKNEHGYTYDIELSPENMKDLVQRFKQVYKDHQLEFPSDPHEQLKKGIYAVFNSWENDRAKVYRQVNQITGLKGTAVNVQAMVYGNFGKTSGTGVLFTRNPATGENKLYGEYLINAQGEDVVAGIRTPEPISKLAEELPDAYIELKKNCDILEQHYHDMMDIEFTVQEGVLYMLQCRLGKRTGDAALRIAVEMVEEGLVQIPQAINMVECRHLEQLLHPQFKDEKEYQKDVLTRGLPASPGAAVGRAVFTAEEAHKWHADGEKVILIRKETSPEDVKGMFYSEGILTQLGGMTSHAAVVARGWGKPCVVGCSQMMVQHKQAIIGSEMIKEGDWISLNGSKGDVIKGKQSLKPHEVSKYMQTLQKWIDEHKRIQVMANVDTPEDAEVARSSGAEGVGLARTEHMFFKTAARIKAVRKMILAADKEKRKAALVDIEKFQQNDFEGIFRAMAGQPVTVRLIDPPLHEFLPSTKDTAVLTELCAETGCSMEHIIHTIEGTEEANPMLGFRGCRLTITYPEIGECQVRAIFQAAVEVERAGVAVFPKVMIPLVGTAKEFQLQEQMVRSIANQKMEESGLMIDFQVGTMIEVPRAVLVSDQIAKSASFFSFGTNDLTQMTYGYSRDDVGKFIHEYIEKGILPHDPFQVLDQEGVGELIKMSIERGHSTNPQLKIGLCGEQGGEPGTVKFLHRIGVDYVSCSPFRVPIARLAAAQVAVDDQKSF